MAQVPSNIFVGAARIFLGVTAPASGTPPTLTTHASGVPGTGTEVGYTNGPTTFLYKATKMPIDAEQSLNPVDIMVTGEEAQLDFMCMEHVYNTMKTAFDNIGNVNDGSKMLFYGGDSTALITPTTQCVVLSSPRRDASTKFEILTLYKVYNLEGVQVAWQKTTPAMYKMTVKALCDTTRNVGDRLFQFFREY